MIRLLCLAFVALWLLCLVRRGAEPHVCEVYAWRVRLLRQPRGYGRAVIDGRVERRILVLSDRRLEWRT